MVYVNKATQTHQNQEVVDALNKLKRKIISDYKLLLKHLSKGHRVDYSFIMDEQSILDNIPNILEKDNFYFIIQKYNNTKWVVNLY